MPQSPDSHYDVVLLVEQPLTEQDTRQVRGLHEGLEEPVRYHVLLAVEENAAEVQTTLASLGSADMMTTPAPHDPEEAEHLQQELLSEGRRGLDSSLAAMRETGATAEGQLLCCEPVAGLVRYCSDVDAAEVIVMTMPHTLAEFFHVDWTSRARRRLEVPVLHLLEHETFDAQAERYGEEGVTGF